MPTPIGPVRIGIRLDTTKSFHRSCLRGLLTYIQQFKPAWSLTSDAANRMWLVRPVDLPDFHPDILVGVFKENELYELRKKHVRCISLLTHVSDGKVPVIASDDRAIGRMAANHFADQQIQNGIYYGIVRQQTHSTLRYDGFAEAMQERTGIVPTAMSLDLDKISFRGNVARQKHLDEIVTVIRAAIAARGAPVGVFAFSDDLGATIIESCLSAGLSIPDDVAVIGVDNDDLICEMLSPALTSIKQNGAGIGFRTGEMLDSMLRDIPLPESPILFPPLSLVVRPSSDTVAIKDPLVARAVKIIRTTVGDSMNVNQLAAQLKISRRLLAKRFREALDRTPHEEIARTRIRLAKQLLANTNMTNLAIAVECGFSGENRFEQKFHKLIGMTPYTYRKNIFQSSGSNTPSKGPKKRAPAE